MNALKTSIVITNYNYGRFVARCIDSALAQSYRDTEVVAWTMPREIILGKPSRAMGRAYSRYCKRDLLSRRNVRAARSMGSCL